MLGSVCFLVASYLAYVEVSHGWASLAPVPDLFDDGQYDGPDDGSQLQNRACSRIPAT